MRSLFLNLGKGVLVLITLLLAFGATRWLKHIFSAQPTKYQSVVTLELRLPPDLQPDGTLRTDAAPDNPPASLPDSPDRVADARTRHGDILAARFARAGVHYPPREIFLRAFKYEGVLELWARSDSGGEQAPFRLIDTYPIIRASGRLGPKRREGDFQVPEGFYTIDRFNPRSLFHLSLGLNYPNASDRILASDRTHAGYDVFIHGGSESAGCLAMGDPVSEELFLAAWDAKQAGQNDPPVHIFPCRMDARLWGQLLTPASRVESGLEAFWRGLQKGYDAFEQTHRVPAVQIMEDGSYVCLTPGHT